MPLKEPRVTWTWLPDHDGWIRHEEGQPPTFEPRHIFKPRYRPLSKVGGR